MGSSVLSGVMGSAAKSIAAGEEPKISRFIATVNSQKSADTLRQRFSKYSDIFQVTKGGNVEAMAKADVIMWAFKPYMVDEVLKGKGVQKSIAGKLVISVLAGSPVPRLEEAVAYPLGLDNVPFDERFFVQRAMPNIGAEYGQSMTVMETAVMSPHHKDLAEWIFQQVGKTSSVSPENFGIAGVLAGTASASLSIAFDGILDGAVSQGLKRADARKILTQSLMSLVACLEAGEHPAVIREKVSSPQGTTIAGLLSLEEDRARYAYSKATIASYKRGQEISNQK